MHPVGMYGGYYVCRLTGETAAPRGLAALQRSLQALLTRGDKVERKRKCCMCATVSSIHVGLGRRYPDLCSPLCVPLLARKSCFV